MNNDIRTLAQNKRLYQLLNTLRLNNDDAKAGLAFSYSNQRTDKTSELTVAECDELIKHLEGQIAQTDLITIKKKRSKVLFLAVKAGMGEAKKVNYAKFNAFMLNKSVCKKPLVDYSSAELDKLITQLNQIIKHNKEAEASKQVSELLEGTKISRPRKLHKLKPKP